MTDKSTLRKHALQNRKSIPQDDAALCARFLDAFAPTPDTVLAFFWPMTGEPDTRHIANAFHNAGAKCALPCIRTDGQHGLIFREWTPNTQLIKTNFGTLEPQDTKILHPTHMLIPMLMADASGNRLGRGAGHYDATLDAGRPNHAIGIIYDHQLYAGTLPTDPHDQPLDMLITPTQTLRFKTA